MPTEKETSSAIGVGQAKTLAKKLVSLDKVPEYFLGKNKDGIKKFSAKHPTLRHDEPYEQDEVFTGSNKKKDTTTMNADLDLGADEYVYDVKEAHMNAAQKKRREKFVKKMKPVSDWEKRYGKRGEGVMYATATKMAMKEDHHPMMEMPLSHAARELVLHSDNDSKQYKSSKAPIEKNLTKKWKKGQYDHALAHKLWMHHANRAAQAYHKEHGNKNLPWHHMFSVADRNQAAHHWANGWHEEMKAGNLHESTDLDEDMINELGDQMSPAPATSDNPAPGGVEPIGTQSADSSTTKEADDGSDSESVTDAKEHLEAIAMASAEAFENVSGSEEIPGWVLEKLKLAQDFVESALKHIGDSNGEGDESEETPGKSQEPSPTTKPDANEAGKAAMAKEEVEFDESVGTNMRAARKRFDVVVSNPEGKEVKVHKNVGGVNDKHAKKHVLLKYPIGHTAIVYPVNEEVELDESNPSAGLSAKKKSAVVKKAKKGEKIGHGGFAALAAKAAKEYGSKESGKKVAAAAMWKHLKR
jgi:hypothetical protein